MNAIGRYLEGQLESAQSATGPDGATWFIPDPNSYMTCDIMRANLQKLNNFIADISQYTTSANRTELDNSFRMLDIFKNKMALYQQAISTSCVVVDQTGLPVPETETDLPEPIESGGIWQMIKSNPIPVAAIAFFIINALLPANKKLIKF